MLSVNNIVTKIKKIKHIEVILIAILSIVILVAWLATSKENVATKCDNLESYYDSMQIRAERVIGAIDGVNDVAVAISYVSGVGYEYAVDSAVETKGDSTVTTTEVVMVNGSPLIIKELPPTISGIVVVASVDCDQAVAKMYIQQAVKTLLNIKESSIQVITYRK